jgi:hypothetical protein
VAQFSVGANRPAGTSDDIMGPDGYRTALLFQASMPELRNDLRFPRLCARLGLVEFWDDYRQVARLRRRSALRLQVHVRQGATRPERGVRVLAARTAAREGALPHRRLRRH